MNLSPENFSPQKPRYTKSGRWVEYTKNHTTTAKIFSEIAKLVSVSKNHRTGATRSLRKSGDGHTTRAAKSPAARPTMTRAKPGAARLIVRECHVARYSG